MKVSLMLSKKDYQPYCFSVSAGRHFDICFGKHLSLKGFGRVKQAPVFFFQNEGRARSNDGKKGEESGLLSPSRVFLAHSKKRTKRTIWCLPGRLLKERRNVYFEYLHDNCFKNQWSDVRWNPAFGHLVITATFFRPRQTAAPYFF